MKRIGSLIMAAMLMIVSVFGYYTPVSAAEEGKELKIIFTSDIHDFYDSTKSLHSTGQVLGHGGAAKAETLIKKLKNENSVVVDAGDFAMGTLYQSGYATDAYELRLLGQMGIEYTTFGNHEFDYGPAGLASMLNAAKNSNETVPQILSCNINRTKEYTGDSLLAAKALDDYGVKSYDIKEINGMKVAFFGVMGPDSVKDSPTAGLEFINHIEAAQKTVDEIGDKADFIVCISHGGVKADGKSGDDVELAKKVKGIDVIVSGHQHNSHKDSVKVGDTIIVDSGCYLYGVGELALSVGKDGKILSDKFILHAVDGEEPNKAVEEKVSEFKKNVEATYLAAYNLKFDQVLAKCNFNFTTLKEMYATHTEYPIGNLIADSYKYVAKQNGVNVDVALVGLGTIRGSFSEGDITVGKAFELCSLGVGSDGSAGHPIIVVHVKGKDLKLLAELDASLGNFVSSIKMSYSGLQMKYNNRRMLLDRVTDVKFVTSEGKLENFEDDKLYTVCLNMYAANMVGMLNGLTKGLLSVAMLDENGNPVENAYDYVLKDKDGREVKEWYALVEYLQSFEKENGVSVIPEKYNGPEGRKVAYVEGGFSVIANPGISTLVVIALPVLLILIIVLILKGIFSVVRKVKKGKA